MYCVDSAFDFLDQRESGSGVGLAVVFLHFARKRIGLCAIMMTLV